MGFGKFLLGAISVVGAVVAAPIVLPAAAAVGSAALAAGGAAAAGAAAAGSAVAAGAAAVGGTVAAGATAVGGAVASTAVGSAVIGGATAVGTAASAAGTALASTAVGSAVVGGASAVTGAVASGVAAVGTAASAAGTAIASSTVGSAVIGGATAVGNSAVAIASSQAVIGGATVVGATTTGAGVLNLMEASDIVKAAEARYNRAKEKMDLADRQVDDVLTALGDNKLKISQSFKEFYAHISQIKNCKHITASPTTEKFSISKQDLDELEKISVSAITMGSVGSVGLALGGVSALAWRGGATAVARILGSRLVIAPLAAISGIFMLRDSCSKLEEAKLAAKKADQAVEKMRNATTLLVQIKDVTITVDTELRTLFAIYKEQLRLLASTIAQDKNFKNYTLAQKKNIEHSILTTKVLKNLVVTKLLDEKGERQVINKKEVNSALKGASDLRIKELA